MVIADIIGLKVQTVDHNSRRSLKIRFDNATEIHLAGPSWTDETGQNFSDQRLVGAAITSAAFSGSGSSRIVTIGFTERSGKTGQLISSDVVHDLKAALIAS